VTSRADGDSEMYRPRAFWSLGVDEREDWRLKLYGITYSGESPDPRVVEAALQVARARLPQPPGSGGRKGIGFFASTKAVPPTSPTWTGGGRNPTSCTTTSGSRLLRIQRRFARRDRMSRSRAYGTCACCGMSETRGCATCWRIPAPPTSRHICWTTSLATSRSWPLGAPRDLGSR
jgi:hypothetical protein